MLFGAQSKPVDPRIERVRADQVAMLYKRASFGVFAAMIGGSVIFWFLDQASSLPKPVLHVWLAAMIFQSLGRLALFKAYKHAKNTDAQWRFWAWAFTAGALIGGLTWGVGGLWLMDPGRIDYQLLFILTICAMVYAALSTYGTYTPAFYAFLFPALVPPAIWSALQPDVEHHAFTWLSVIWIPAVAIIARRFSRGVVESLDLHYRNIDLLDAVRLEKERAEEANLAKSRFLAAASHDLRQPVHALALSVGALKGHAMSDGARRLVGHIEGSTIALDELFSSLLDISRLDAGVIQVERRDFAIAPLLERICQDQQAEAAQKGIALRLVPCSAVVHSDPILLARVLRNIVSNAVRYTERGRVMIGCRRGAQLGIEVWDTGPGIAAGYREQVFSEFFQIANPGRDRSKGLGLGLAIVRRLTRLLDMPLQLKSEVGRGSVFRVSVPLSTAAVVAETQAGAEIAPGQGLVLVIDDELPIQEAMASLLEGWGFSVITASSGQIMLEKIASCPHRPALIICDYRLEAENGIAVIRRLQTEFNEEVPAMLVTGDTAPDRLVEARASGFILLHKPLNADRLRSAIADAIETSR